ncbi:hypothetical protein U1Q18_002678 [Sarracenia purpurea var. burkii]
MASVQWKIIRERRPQSLSPVINRRTSDGPNAGAPSSSPLSQRRRPSRTAAPLLASSSSTEIAIPLLTSAPASTAVAPLRPASCVLRRAFTAVH